MINLVTIMCSEHEITVKIAAIGRKERVFHDGKLVSEKESIFGEKHHFKVHEYGKTTEYEVYIKQKSYRTYCPLLVIKRNGETVFSGYDA